MDARWHGFTFPVFGRGSLHLMRRLDAIAAQNDGEGECEEASQTRWYFDRAAREEPYRLRRFVASAELWQLSPGALPDWALVGAVKDLIARGDLVGVYREAPGSRKAKTNDGAAQQRQLVRNIERETRGKLMNSGRTYKLTADLAGVPDRDRYEVVLQHDAQRILDDLASQAGTSSSLGVLLAQARDRLTRDWRPPFQPDGLILLRRVVAARMPTVDPGPAMTPSQLRKAKLGWIVVELVDDEDEPWELDVDLTSIDGSKSSYNFAKAGVFSRDNIEPGSVTVALTYKAPVTSAPESAAVPEEEPSPAAETQSPVAAERATATAPQPNIGVPLIPATVPLNHFEIRLLDDLDQPLDGIDVLLSISGMSHALITDSSGVARLDDAMATSASFAFVDPSQVLTKLK